MSITHAHALMLYRACDGSKRERADSKNLLGPRHKKIVGGLDFAGVFDARV